jgi:hypothetical protein
MLSTARVAGDGFVPICAAVAATRIRRPASAATGTYVEAVAPAIAVHSFARQRSHWYATSTPEPTQRPLNASSL